MLRLKVMRVARVGSSFVLLYFLRRLFCSWVVVVDRTTCMRSRHHSLLEQTGLFDDDARAEKISRRRWGEPEENSGKHFLFRLDGYNSSYSRVQNETE